MNKPLAPILCCLARLRSLGRVPRELEFTRQGVEAPQGGRVGGEGRTSPCEGCGLDGFQEFGLVRVHMEKRSAWLIPRVCHTP